MLPAIREPGELKDVRNDVPTIYVGETSRSIQERSQEHWSSFRSKSNKSHIHVHQMLEHGGEPPNFIMRAVSYHKTALSRQVKEAVRIRRRGGAGAILNSKSEFNRCHIPRLQMEEEETEGAREREESEAADKANEELTGSIAAWEQQRIKTKAAEGRSKLWRRGGAKNRLVEEQEPRSSRQKRGRLGTLC